MPDLVSPDPGSILFIETAFIGDVAFAAPAIAAVRRKWPAARLAALLTPEGGEALAAIDLAHETLVYDKRGGDRGLGGFLRLRRRLRAEGFDLAISTHRSARSALLARAAAPVRVGFDVGLGARLYTIRAPWDPSEEPELPRRTFGVARALGCAGGDEALRPSPRALADARAALERAGVPRGGRRVAFAFGAKWPTKRWGVERWGGLARRIGAGGGRVLLLGGPGDRDLGAAIVRAGGGGVVNLAGTLPLAASLALLTLVDRLVAGDTGTLHWAQVFGVPAVALFGPTSERQFASYRSTRFVTAPVPCRPCSPHGPRRCPLGHTACMGDLTVDSVVDAVEGIFK